MSIVLLIVIIVLVLVLIVHYATKRRQLDDETLALQATEISKDDDPLFSSPETPVVIPTASFTVALPTQHDATDACIKLYLTPNSQRTCSAYQFLQAMLNSGFQLGDDQCFYRHEHDHGRGRILFSASMLPRDFNPSDLLNYHLQEICLCLAIKHSQNLIAEFNLLYHCAKQLAEDLQMNILSDTHAPFDQTQVERYKQAIMVHEQQRLDEIL